MLVVISLFVYIYYFIFHPLMRSLNVVGLFGCELVLLLYFSHFFF